METHPDIPISPMPGNVVLPTYEAKLAADPRWAVAEGSLFFEGKGAVQESLRRIAARLNELEIPYAVAGGMALYQHGYRRFTEYVDILVTREGLKAIHQALDGRGYVRPFEKSKNLRDAETRVKIEFLLAGDYPGDGKPKAVQFPDPRQAAVEIDGIKFVNLPMLVELKLASGMTGSDRMKDLADVQGADQNTKPPARFSKRAEQVRPSGISEAMEGCASQTEEIHDHLAQQVPDD